MENKENIYGYHENRKIPYLKITVALQKLVAPARRLLESGSFVCPGFPSTGYKTFESNVDFEVYINSQLNKNSESHSELEILKMYF